VEKTPTPVSRESARVDNHEASVTRKFTPERRERLLGALEGGRNIEQALAIVGISRATLTTGAARGRRPDADADVQEFARRFDAIREGHGEARLSEDDVWRLLEKQARGGSVTAQRELLRRFREEREARELQRDPLERLMNGPLNWQEAARALEEEGPA